jgi:hypothetical protein
MPCSPRPARGPRRRRQQLAVPPSLRLRPDPHPGRVDPRPAAKALPRRTRPGDDQLPGRRSARTADRASTRSPGQGDKHGSSSPGSPPEHPRTERIHVGQPQQAGLIQRRSDHPPGHREARRCFRDGPARADDRVDELVPEPAGGADTAWDFWRGFKERQPVASRLFAVPAVSEHIHRPGDKEYRGAAGGVVPSAGMQ